MGIFKNKNTNEEKKIKYMSVKPVLKKMYGRNYKLMSEISSNTKALEEIAEQLKKINQNLSR